MKWEVFHGVFSLDDCGARRTAGKTWWVYTLLGVVLMFAGALVLGNLAYASTVNAIWIAAAIVIAGAYQVLQALRARGRRGYLLDLLVGVLYVVGGAILLYNPLRATFSLTFLLGIIWIASGLVRFFLADSMGKGRRAFLLSGAVSILAGIVILAQWPSSGLWVLGLCLAIDLIFQGIAWTAYSFLVLADQRPQGA